MEGCCNKITACKGKCAGCDIAWIMRHHELQALVAPSLRCVTPANAHPTVSLPCQADTPWRKVAAKLEGEPAYEELDKVDRVDVYAEYIRCLTADRAHSA